LRFQAGKIHHENTKQQKHEKRRLDFVISSFRVFVMKEGVAKKCNEIIIKFSILS